MCGWKTRPPSVETWRVSIRDIFVGVFLSGHVLNSHVDERSTRLYTLWEPLKRELYILGLLSRPTLDYDFSSKLEKG